MTPSCHHDFAANHCPACARAPGSARSEHSVLFSVARLATTRPITAQGEGSGLIDVRAMQATLGDRTDTRVSFITPSSTLLPAAAAPVIPIIPILHPTAAASQKPLYAVVAALMFGLTSLTAFVLSEPPPSPPPSPRHTIPAPVVLAAAPELPAQLDEPAPEPRAVAELPAPPTRIADPPARRKPARPTVSEPVRPAPTATAVATPPAPNDDDSTMKCLLGTGVCRVERSTTPTPTVAEPVAASTLPERLTDTDITAATTPAKANATDLCARLARGAERVRIKLSIAGPTGTVIRASAEDDGGNPALASCCAAQLEKARFKKVQRPQMGALVTLKF